MTKKREWAKKRKGKRHHIRLNSEPVDRLKKTQKQRCAEMGEA